MKRKDQCDFGNCERPAEVLLICERGVGREERPMCNAHAGRSFTLVGREFKLTKSPLGGEHAAH